MQPRSKSANCPHTELIKAMVTSSKIKMKFSPSERPMTCLKITTIRRVLERLTISTYSTNCLHFFSIHINLIFSLIAEIMHNKQTRS